AAREQVGRLADADVGLEREAAEKREHAAAAAPAGFVPGGVRDHRRGDRERERGGEIEASVAGQRAGAEQHRERRKRHAELTEKHRREQQRIAVLEDEAERAHGRRPRRLRTAATCERTKSTNARTFGETYRPAG